MANDTEKKSETEQEFKLLSYANENGKFAIPLTYVADSSLQNALERLQLRRWIRLADVTLISAASGIHRVFLLEPEAMEALAQWRVDHPAVGSQEGGQPI